MICPNLGNPEIKDKFKQLVDAIGEPLAHYVYDKNNGNFLDKTSTGADSQLYQDLLKYYNGDIRKTIREKSKIYSKIPKQDIVEKTTEPIDNTGKEIDKKIEIINKDINNILNSFDKSQIKITFATNKTLLDTSDPIVAKMNQDKIKNKYKELKELINCIWT